MSVRLKPLLYIDDARAGQHRQAFRSAAKRFWEMHQNESFFLASRGMEPQGFRVIVREYAQAKASPLVIQIADDPERSILTALDTWWLGQQGRALMN
jgi:hypothetical protein